MLSKITDSINKINTKNSILLGDFNFRGINWETMAGSRELEDQFIFAINDNLLTQLVSEPTRLENILDLAFVGDTSTVQQCAVDEPFSTSDHRSVYLEVNCLLPRINRAPRKVHLYSKGNYQGLDQELANTNWDFIKVNRNIEDSCSRFKTILYQSGQ